MEHLRSLQEKLPGVSYLIRDMILEGYNDKDGWPLVRGVLNLIKPICLEAQEITIRNGKEAGERYTKEVLATLRDTIDFLNNLTDDQETLQKISHFKKVPDFDYTLLVFKSGELTNMDYLLRLNRMYLFLFNKWVAHITKPTGDIFHRHYAIADNYKIESGEAEQMPAKDIRTLYGQKRYEAVCSLMKMGANYSAPKADEIKVAIKLLSDFPKARALAKKELKRLLES